MKARSGVHAKDQVEDQRWDAFRPGVLALLLPAVHQVVAMAEGADQLGDLPGVVLEVGVQCYDDLPARFPEASRQGLGFAKVSREADYADRRAVPLDLFQHRGRRVDTAVVDQENLE